MMGLPPLNQSAQLANESDTLWRGASTDSDCAEQADFFPRWYSAGVRQYMIVNVPPFGRTPRWLGAGEDRLAALSGLIHQWVRRALRSADLIRSRTPTC